MRQHSLALAAVLFLAGTVPATAQNFLMNSAETINRGNFKLAGFPTVLLGENGGDSEWGIATRVGYGLTSSFDVEAKFAFFDGLKLYGGDAELWLIKGQTDVSVAVGGHIADFEGDVDSKALDTSLLVSRNVGSSLELYGGLSASFESPDAGDSFTRFYVVPGIEYRISEEIDLLAEFGLGLTDESPNYVSFGLAFYIR